MNRPCATLVGHWDIDRLNVEPTIKARYRRDLQQIHHALADARPGTDTAKEAMRDWMQLTADFNHLVKMSQPTTSNAVGQQEAGVPASLPPDAEVVGQPDGLRDLMQVLEQQHKHVVEHCEALVEENRRLSEMVGELRRVSDGLQGAQEQEDKVDEADDYQASRITPSPSEQLDAELQAAAGLVMLS